MTSAAPHSAQLSGEANVHYPQRFLKRTETPTERLSYEERQVQPAGSAITPSTQVSITRSAVTIHPPERRIDGHGDDRPTTPSSSGQGACVPAHAETGSKRTRAEAGSEPTWTRRPLAEVPEASRNAVGGRTDEPCVAPHGCAAPDTARSPRPGEASSMEGTVPPLDPPVQPGHDCPLSAHPKGTSPGVGTGAVDAPTRVPETAGRGAPRLPIEPGETPAAIPWPTGVVPSPAGFDPHYGVAGSLEGALGVWRWQWNAGSRSASCPLAKSQHEMGCTCGDPPRHEWMFVPDDSFLANLLKIGLVDLERMETRAYDQFAILDEGLFNTEASLLLDSRMRQVAEADGRVPGHGSLHGEYAPLRKIILDHYEALAAAAVRWVEEAVRLITNGIGPRPSQPTSPTPPRVSYVAVALNSNENEMAQAAGHIDRIHLDHYSAGVYAPDAAGTLGTEPPKGGPKNPSHDRFWILDSGFWILDSGFWVFR